jgi:hypothetical protein
MSFLEGNEHALGRVRSRELLPLEPWNVAGAARDARG